MKKRLKLLIEDWFPIETLGAESKRERGASSALPPLYFLHVWWARRPLLVSRAAILASLLPVWRNDWTEELQQRFPDEESYREWFVELCGIFGDPVAGRKLIQWANARDIRLKSSPYEHDRAFKVDPSSEHRQVLGDLLEATWGRRDLTMLDSFAGGGSIPFESLRYELNTIANELNPVACVILKATLDYPFRFGPDLRKDIHRYGKRLAERVGSRLEPFFPEDPDGSIHAYMWARTVKCPYTGKPIPLSPNWWISKGKNPVAVKPVFDTDADQARFEVVRGKKAVEAVSPNDGTVSYGKGISPWAQNQPVDGDYIKAEAQAGRMGQQLYCVAIKKSRGFDFRPPTDADVEAVEKAEAELEGHLAAWRAKGWVPDEPYPDQSNDSRPLQYGMPTWKDMFSPRQLLSLCTYVEEFHRLREEIEQDLPEQRAKAVVTYLGIALDKALDYNSRMTRWHTGRRVMVNTFDRHDFSFKWSHGEFDAGRNLFPWVIGQVEDAYKGIASLAARQDTMFEEAGSSVPVRVTLGNALDLAFLDDASVDLVCTDPPYYDNVMYAELADFFYVWMKRTLGDVHPEFFQSQLTNKDEEAVANPARFEAMGRKKKRLALEDYERKMAASFREAGRVLTEEGVLTVMFTHKKVEAWDTLASSLIEAGFAIHSSWPVHTESEHSLHQAKKNAAKSTILLTCRKREERAEPVWWDDIRGEVRRRARQTAEELEGAGIAGVDLYIATFGPTLSILSERWPVLTSEVDEKTGKPKTLRPEVALDLAREEVLRLRKQGLLLGREVQFDPITDWYLMAWDTFQAERFPADEARKLAIALGLDLEQDIVSDRRLVSKKGSDVILKRPAARRRRGQVGPDVRDFATWVDAAHTAMLIYGEDGSAAAEAFLRETGYRADGRFKALVQALINAIPRVRKNGKLVRPEAQVLEDMRLAFFDDLEVPEPEAEEVVVQEELLPEDA